MGDDELTYAHDWWCNTIHTAGPRLCPAYKHPLHGLTLGEAVEMLSWAPIACACVGGVACCAHRFRQAAALQRGAHIMARLIADAACRLEEPA